MARQSTSPVPFARNIRPDEGMIATSGRAGVVVPIAYIPFLREESGSGSIGVDCVLNEMPRPIENAVMANVQAWFVPKEAHPQFSGLDEVTYAYNGQDIKTLGNGGEESRPAPSFFHALSAPGQLATIEASDMFRTLGIHPVAGEAVNADLIDAFNLIYNFRLAAHTSRLERRKYATENITEATSLPPAFRLASRFSSVVPDYERALIVGALSLDVQAGELPLSGLGTIASFNAQFAGPSQSFMEPDGTNPPYPKYGRMGQGDDIWYRTKDENGQTILDVFAKLGGSDIDTTLASVDKARLSQSFAMIRSSMAGNDSTGFDNDDAIVADLMRGFRVPEENFKRPWLLDSAVVPFAMGERHATDAANLDVSLTQGVASAVLSLNVPQTPSGGIVIVTIEVQPERIDERQSDEWLHTIDVSALPDALRDVQREEPVDTVLARRLDARHTAGNTAYGFEPMNAVWNRSYTRLGGAYYQEDPENPFLEQRAGLWTAQSVDPEYTRDHHLCPVPFPHDVFSDTLAPAFELVARHSMRISTLVQQGDVLSENNDDYDAVRGEEDDE